MPEKERRIALVAPAGGYVGPALSRAVDRFGRIDAAAVFPPAGTARGVAFGSDFPHGEGLPDPMMYMSQLKNLDDGQVKAIMRDNLSHFLDVPA